MGFNSGFKGLIIHQELQTDSCDIVSADSHVSSYSPTDMTVVFYIPVLQLLRKLIFIKPTLNMWAHSPNSAAPLHCHRQLSSYPEHVDYEI